MKSLNEEEKKLPSDLHLLQECWVDASSIITGGIECQTEADLLVSLLYDNSAARIAVELYRTRYASRGI